MILKAYQQKKTLKKASIPMPEVSVDPSCCLPIFCIQKHAASHLHYDFRIECQGVLISWAIPKGPSLNPYNKRLAIRVEDHPLAYRHFEGVIPPGNYGAGEVVLWDEGIYTLAGLKAKKDIENACLKGLEKGHLEIELHGHKLKGGFVLQQWKKEKDKNWLLIKRKDQYVNLKIDVLEQTQSVRTCFPNTF
ncbi:hypothetical protein NEOC84_000703|uniref:DNA polymerase ligase N-terminal domain-containing protein n=1 Tax=Neochlamydia sp. AcF84 TaxID=2315858 RepID=UPI00140ACDB8|nr:DNA polymerase ligase N-terminal domain-containing protein [Neochlamydia sp. AcF84]NGY94807.1 hypothetical protein [Neochlamydia sp. AcF84]